MKRSKLTLIMLITCLLASCGRRDACIGIYPIQDNPSPRLMARALFPDAPDSLIASLGLENGIPASVCAFLVKTEGKEILFDAANGAEDSQLMPTLDSLGTEPDEIDCIFITHLHGDHIGGLVRDGAASFPSAEIYINKIEYEAWMNMEGGPSETLKAISDTYAGRIRTFLPGEELPFGIEAMEAYGHTPGHTVYRVGDIIIAGDIMHGTALQMKHPEFCARFDMDKEMAAESRREILKIAEEGMKVYGMHFPAPYHL